VRGAGGKLWSWPLRAGEALRADIKLRPPACSSVSRPIRGSERSHRASSSPSIRVALPSFRADSSPPLMARTIRPRDRPISAAASKGVYAIRLSWDLDLEISFVGSPYIGVAASHVVLWGPIPNY
jgi:hypothetical protein